MSDTHCAAPVHPVLAGAAVVEAAVKDVADVQPVFMTTTEKAEAIVRLGRVADQVSVLRLRVLAVAGDVAEAEAARDVAAWLAHHTLVERATARRDTQLANELEGRSPTASCSAPVTTTAPTTTATPAPASPTATSDTEGRREERRISRRGARATRAPCGGSWRR